MQEIFESINLLNITGEKHERRNTLQGQCLVCLFLGFGNLYSIGDCCLFVRLNTLKTD